MKFEDVEERRAQTAEASDFSLAARGTFLFTAYGTT
jgi:hypothetical protein